jgi:hypothetical protein
MNAIHTDLPLTDPGYLADRSSLLWQCASTFVLFALYGFVPPLHRR